jgi:hypothetical protein
MSGCNHEKSEGSSCELLSRGRDSGDVIFSVITRVFRDVFRGHRRRKFRKALLRNEVGGPLLLLSLVVLISFDQSELSSTPALI